MWYKDGKVFENPLIIGGMRIYNPPPETMRRMGYICVTICKTQKTLNDVLARFDAAIESYLYKTRAARGYTVREPSVYLTSSNIRWKTDAEDWVAFRDRVMEYGLSELNKAKETKKIPKMSEFMANMPTITWSYSDN